MKILLLVATTLISPADFAVAQENDASRALTALARQARDSVVSLNVLGPGGRPIANGTGFFVEEHRLVTNWHVIERASRVEAALTNGDVLQVLGLVAADEVNDLALLEVGGGPFPPLTLASSAGLEAGERIVVLGNPLGLSGTLSEGIVSAVRDGGLAEGVPEASDAPLLQITAAISPGSSGSPVMNRNGQVIGVAVSQFVLGQNLNFAVPSALVAKLLEEAAGRSVERDFKTQRTAARGAYLRNVLISLVLFVALYLTFKYWT